MSYWDEQYSQSPFGPSASIPAARRNRGRPRKGGRSKAPAPAGDNKWARMSASKLKSSKSPSAKKELARRKRNNAAATRPARRAASATTTARKPTRKQYDSFRKKAVAAGLSQTQISSKWKEYKAGKGTIASLLAKGKKPAAKKKTTTARRASSSAISWPDLRAQGTKKGVFRVGMTRKALEKALGKSTKPKAKAKAKATAKPKTKATTAARKLKPGAYGRFMKKAKARGYTVIQGRKKYKQYKAGQGTMESLLPAKTSRASGRTITAKKPRTQKSRKGLNRYNVWRRSLPSDTYTREQISMLWEEEKHALLNPHDATHVRGALAPADYDYWDNAVPTAIHNPHSDPWHPVYDQVIGQFSPSETFGVQPANRRNPKPKKRKAKRNSNPNAKRAMKLYHSGQADSLAEAWAMVKGY